MKQQSTEPLMESRPSWEDVEAFARQRIQTWFQRLLEEEVEELLGRARYARREGIDAAAGYRLVLPAQAVGPVQVVYRPLDHIVLEIHSHHRYPARFSATDDADEQRLCLYGVLGRLDRARPEVALRVGAYGHFLPVPWETVFAGDRGAFRDASFEPETEGTTGDDVPNRHQPYC